MADAGTESAQGSPFWRFSLGFYRQPGVADACIALQDECGVDVNVLLFFLWLAAAQKADHGADQARAVWEQAALWRDDVVAPLRARAAQAQGRLAARRARRPPSSSHQDQGGRARIRTPASRRRCSR